MGCLDERERALASLLKVIGDDPAAAVAKGIDATGRLPDVASCAAAEYVTAAVRPPEPAQAERAAALTKRLEHLRALEASGKHDALDEPTETLLADAESLGYGPLVARAIGARANVLTRANDHENAAALLERGFELALEHGDHEQAVRIAADLGFTIGTRQDRHDAGRVWLKTAHGLSKQHPVEPRTIGALLTNEATLEMSAGAYEASVAKFDEAANYVREQLGTSNPLYGQVRTNQGLALTRHGDYARASEVEREAVAVWSEVYGPRHPRTTMPMNNLAIALDRSGEDDEAAQLFERVMRLRGAALGEDHPQLLSPMVNLGNLYKDLRRYDEAWAVFSRARTLAEAKLGPDHVTVSTILHNAAIVKEAAEEWDAAQSLYGEALTIREAKLGPDHVRLAYPLTGIGTVLVKRGIPEEAVEPLRRAVTIRERAATQPRDLAESRFMLGRALVESGRDPREGDQLVAIAREGFVAAGKGFEGDLAALDEWRARREKR
jgi:tetratricopeptide (TPR) repeat protein